MDISPGWFAMAAIVVMAARQVPRILRDMKGPLPDVGSAPDDAEPMAFVLPNDDGLFTSSLRFPEGDRRSDER
ncbi:MAG TPA: hypothetical protein VFW95_07985 [Candidatus Limnocylindria bacterium]|nr:hypothetical protein [Candidatus Limnocylindria bacterium]